VSREYFPLEICINGKHHLPLRKIFHRNIFLAERKKESIMDRLKNVLRNNWLTLVGGVVGGAGGYLYWLNVGCTTGACPITSSPVMSAVWGAAMGILVFSMFKTERRKQ
jgi:hypothetical protein